jgi:alkane 1-monooxygenase
MRRLNRPLPVVIFAFAAASPLGLLIMACVWGGVWVWLALAYMALAALAIDTLVPMVAGSAEGEEFPAADVVLAVLGLGALILLPLLVRQIGGPSGLGLAARIGLFLAGGFWFGQVAHPAAHEMIHRSGRFLFALGAAVYTALLFGHHTSAHRLVHHRFVASGQDPNSARAGEGFYRFLWRAWPGSLRAGLAAERALRGGRVTPYVGYAGGAMLALAFGYVLAGWAGVLVWLGFGLHFGAQVLLSDYVQHYGLQRSANGPKLEPVGPRHSWNAPHWFSSALMLNAPRHSDHHAHPARPYPALRLEADAPLLPWPLPLACLIALSPRRWRRAMAGPLARLALAKA